MADWYGSGRTNYFKVTDPKKFEELCNLWSIEMISKELKVITDHCEACLHGTPNDKCKDYVKVMIGECQGQEKMQMLYGFLGNTDNGGLPSYRSDEDDKEYDQDDFFREFALLIKPNWVAVMMECGAEKLRYITGYAVAINSNGDKEWVNLNDIYGRTGKIGKYQTSAEH